MCLESLSANNEGKFLNEGYARNDSWAWGTVGGLLYLSTTPGNMVQTAPSGTGDQVQILGIVEHANYVKFDPNLMLIEIQ